MGNENHNPVTDALTTGAFSLDNAPTDSDTATEMSFVRTRSLQELLTVCASLAKTSPDLAKPLRSFISRNPLSRLGIPKDLYKSIKEL